MNKEIDDTMKTIIKLEDVRKSYQNGPNILHVLNGINISIAEGEFCVFTGASGSGKSTLLHVIGGLDTIDNGRIICNSKSISNLPENELPHFRRNIVGFIFQKHFLIEDLTALDNLILPSLMNGNKKKETLEKAEDLLNSVGLYDRKHHHPNQLSGGENQRVAIARAFMNDPKIILADEPTGNLDDDNTKKVLELLLDLVNRQGKTLVLVTHDNEIAKEGDSIFLLKEGVLLEK
ncbi:MAG: ABC transporter ATP-binding protein [Spirochaetia bacterium]|nr:ABC transporter ATP-binding protein [Spirochaetia bacterium]